ncbi:MAG: DUF4395 domain-containing protein [Epsilonproteobacteria bacterium]|nr:DUF4395 domain-containing protein [Campylobacterota bacterium]
MFKSCPISSRRIDSHIVRFISAQVSLVIVLLITTKLPIFAIILLYDFMIRAFRKQHLSLFFIVGRFGVHKLHLKANLCDEAPKRFALFMGLSISFTLSILYISNYIEFATILAGIFLICALLETLFDFCLGCKIYQLTKIFRR